METFFTLEIIINIVLLLMIGRCIIEMYDILTMTEKWKSFLFYTVVLVLAITSFIYTMGRVVLLWLY